MRLCTIQGCGLKHEAKGFCRRHYMAQREKGDPLSFKFIRAKNGEPRRYYDEVALTYDGDECLIWPFARFDRGYAKMTCVGRSHRVSRIICEDVYGPPPTPEHEAAHSCGKGHLGCVAKGHLSWKTPVENQADKIIHGTATRGENNGYAKLDQEKVKEILSLRGVLTNRQIAKNYGIGSTTVSGIQLGKSWKCLPRGIGD